MTSACTAVEMLRYSIGNTVPVKYHNGNETCLPFHVTDVARSQVGRKWVQHVRAFLHRVEFLVVGAYALAAHGLPRATGDLDIWVRPTANNAQRVGRALAAFGSPVEKLRVEDFTIPEIVYQIGVAPRRIDILTSISGVDFEQAWSNKMVLALDGLSVPVLGRSDLIANKRSAGRKKDLADLESLQEPGA